MQGKRKASVALCGMILAGLFVWTACDGDAASDGQDAADGRGGDSVSADVGSDGVGTRDVPSRDTSAGDVGDDVCPPGIVGPANEPCDAEGASCTSTFEWCGRESVSSGCECTDGVWRCWSAGAPLPCHTCCQEDHDADWFCTQSGECVAADGCLSTECCVPGDQGDEWCRSTFGDCSRCEAGETTGTCTPQACE